MGFPSISLDVALSMQVPEAHGSARIQGHGMVVWEASFLLAEFLSRHFNLAQVEAVKELMEESGTQWEGWEEKTGLELGAGLGLPSIVASNLGAKMLATDGDDGVLQLLRKNMEHNAPSCQV